MFFGNTYYVGVAGLSSVLITSNAGLILLDAALPQSVTAIDEHIAKPALERGRPTTDDPQFAIPDNGFPAVRDVQTVADGETLRVGDVAVTAHLTPGSTTWSWRSCEGAHHPEFSGWAPTLARRAKNPAVTPFIDPGACR